MVIDSDCRDLPSSFMDPSDNFERLNLYNHGPPAFVPDTMTSSHSFDGYGVPPTDAKQRPCPDGLAFKPVEECDDLRCLGINQQGPFDTISNAVLHAKQQNISPFVANHTHSPWSVQADPSFYQPQVPAVSGWLPMISVDTCCDYRTSSASSISPPSLTEESPIEEDDDNAPGDEPYAILLERALKEAPNYSMTLRDIYSWFRQHTSKASEPGATGWQNSIRHNLSMNRVCRVDSSYCLSR